jgi:hypothetical protein
MSNMCNNINCDGYSDSSGDDICTRRKKTMEAIRKMSLEYEQNIGVSLHYHDDNITCPYFETFNKRLRTIKCKVVDEPLLLKQFPMLTKNTMSFGCCNQKPDDHYTNGDVITLDKIKEIINCDDIQIIADIINHIIDDAINVELISNEEDKQLAILKMYLKAVVYVKHNNIVDPNQLMIKSIEASIKELMSRLTPSSSSSSKEYVSEDCEHNK